MPASFIRSQALARIKPSATIAISQRARDLAASGRHDIISLSVGEPDFDTSDHVKEAAHQAMRRGQTKYPPIAGIPALREAVSDKFERENGLRYRASQTIVCSGAKQVISNALLASLNAGDEVIIPSPYWVSYPELTLMCGATPVIVPTTLGDRFILKPDALDRAISSRTRWLILNSPANPTGSVYSERDLRALAEVLLRHPQVWILTDDIYEHLVYDGQPFYSFAQIAPELSDRILTVNGVSKAYAMTGWRIGYGAGPTQLIDAMTLVQSQLTGGASVIAQWAALAALTGPQEAIIRWRTEFQTRRDRVAGALDQTPGLRCAVPAGAFYAYPSCEDLIGSRSPNGVTLKTDEAFATALLEEASVAVVHGSAFGLGPYFRVSYAASLEQLTEACERIRAFCERLADQPATKPQRA